MSNWRSKSSNKKFDNKQILKKINTDDSKTLSVTSQSDTINSLNTAIIIENSNTNIKNNENWQLLKNQKQTSKTTDINRFVSRQLPKFFHFDSSLTKKSEQQTSNTITYKTPIELEQILDREFQSLDIDADGYVSIADLQSVLKNFSHMYNSNEIMLRIFDELDLNHDQRISKNEFKLYKNALLNQEKYFNRSTFDENFGSTFAIFDRNHDNYITPHEIRETMHNLGEYIDDDLINEMMQTADTDHDGRISRDEFKKLLSQLHSKK